MTAGLSRACVILLSRMFSGSKSLSVFGIMSVFDGDDDAGTRNAL